MQFFFLALFFNGQFSVFLLLDLSEKMTQLLKPFFLIPWFLELHSSVVFSLLPQTVLSLINEYSLFSLSSDCWNIPAYSLPWWISLGLIAYTLSICQWIPNLYVQFRVWTTESGILLCIAVYFSTWMPNRHLELDLSKTHLFQICSSQSSLYHLVACPSFQLVN